MINSYRDNKSDECWCKYRCHVWRQMSLLRPGMSNNSNLLEYLYFYSTTNKALKKKPYNIQHKATDTALLHGLTQIWTVNYWKCAAHFLQPIWQLVTKHSTNHIACDIMIPDNNSDTFEQAFTNQNLLTDSINQMYWSKPQCQIVKMTHKTFSCPQRLCIKWQ